MAKKILVTPRFDSSAWIFLKSQSNLELKKFPESGDLPWADIGQANGLIIRSQIRIDESFLKMAPQLQVIVTATSGFDHIDLEATQRWGITVMHAPTAHVESVAQLTWSFILNMSLGILSRHQKVKAGFWEREAQDGFELRGKALGIVGLGRIGSRVAELGKLWGMKVYAYDPYIEESVFRETKVDRMGYEELLKSSDVLTFHVPQSQETTGMLSRSHFEYINRGIVLVNTSRGKVISEEGLVEALEQKWVHAAALDVFEKEPLPRTSRLLNLPNVILTPHVGSCTEQAFHKASQEAADKIVRFFLDGVGTDTLPPKALWYTNKPPFLKPN
ncbi:MAG: NAD(P)-dependent oxidoreductase [Bdellovibrionota bacterium]